MTDKKKLANAILLIKDLEKQLEVAKKILMYMKQLLYIVTMESFICIMEMINV